MCFNMSLIAKKDQLAAKYGLNLYEAPLQGWDSIENYNLSGFDFPSWPLIRVSSEVVSNEARPRLSTEQANWGLIPAWAKPEQVAKLRSACLNARAESAHEKASFKDSFFTARCLVPVSGFFEPHKLANGKTQAYYLSHKQGEIFSLAGLTSLWQGKRYFTVLTTAANPLLARIHNKKLRMPIAFFSPAEEQAWLSPQNTPSDLQSLVHSYSAKDYPSLDAWPVANFYGKAKEQVNQVSALAKIELEAQTSYKSQELF